MTQPLPPGGEPTKEDTNRKSAPTATQVLTVLSILVGILTVIVTALGLPKFRLVVFAVAVVAILPGTVRWIAPAVREWRYWDITLIIALAIAVLTAGGAVAEQTMGKHTSPNGNPTGSAVAPFPSASAKHKNTPRLTLPSTPPTHSTCATKLTITSPRQGALVANGADGVVITGQACDLGSSSGWLFELDSQDGYYYDDYNTHTPTPAVPAGINGAWTFNDTPIGDPGDFRKLYTLTLVIASPDCDKALRSMPSIGGDYKLLTFPPGCEIESSVEIYVTSS